MTTTRRQFLSEAIRTSSVVAIGTSVPQFLQRPARGDLPGRGDQILVVVQLSGGNDGLNTVAPYADDAYRRARPTLGLVSETVLRIDDYCGFHPSLAGFARLLEDGDLAIVQGVGYERPNRSHFESMDIWHTCTRDSERTPTGWLGRYLDQRQAQTAIDVPSLHLGAEKQPLALAARNVRTPSLRSLAEFSFQEAATVRELLAEGPLPGPDDADPLLSFISSSSEVAITTSDQVSQRLDDYKPTSPYPDSRLSHKLQQVAQLIDAGLPTQVYYLELDGFDTHSLQADAHAALLRQLGDATATFLEDLHAHDHGDRVLVMAFSEFGRRVEENASRGTDHGAAAPMFVAGQPIRGGMYGEPPSLTDLLDGDLKHAIDFRRVYATLLEKWLLWKSHDVLLGSFAPMDFI